MVQMYWLPASADEVEEAIVGLPVFISEDSDEVIGFITEIGFSGVEPAVKICLWAPVPIDTLVENIVVVAEEVSEDDMSDMLLDAIEEDETIRQIWSSAEVGETPTTYSSRVH